MNTGFLVTTCLCLALGQAPADADYFNQRNLSIPMEIDAALRADIRELLLFASSNQGRDWQQVAGPISAEKGAFAFFAPADGTYWLRVIKINRQGKKEPDEISILRGQPDRIMVIDTLKPIVKLIQAVRSGSDVYVTWDIQEDNPDLGKDGFRVEYQPKGSDVWTPISNSKTIKGNAQFRPGNNFALTIRVTIRDLAGNTSFALAEIPGTIATTGFKETPTPGGNGATLPADLSFGGKPIETPKDPIGPPPTFEGLKKPDLAPPPVTINPPGMDVKPPPGIVEPPTPVVVKENPNDRVIADSRTFVDPLKSPTGAFEPRTTNASPNRRPLPPLQHLNQHQVTLEYELKRVGPSGVGSIELWLTKDDGATWEIFARDEDVQNTAVNPRQQRRFEFRTADGTPFPDAIYGLTLVVKNRAGLGKEPRPGDVPEMRIEIDTVRPIAQMFKPIPDPAQPDHLLIRWNARDKNLGATPINLEYAAKPEGPWVPIKVDLENTGRFANERVSGDFSWKVLADTPTQVYLRLRVRDRSGNEGIAVTSDPQFVDLTEPEGALIRIQTNPKTP
ncbi:MAG: hypothetical protein EXS16_18960 [Gemmataceae bacterium]|nr:hypothetical protein [Gemmataceae bacterium]